MVRPPRGPEKRQAASGEPMKAWTSMTQRPGGAARTNALKLAVALLLAMGAGAAGPRSARAEPATKVMLNGVPTPVFFNDGDSFRVLSGKFAGSKARLSGYNTLESYGPAHQWGAWTAKEMYVLAKMATENARRGVWSCTSDLKTDVYGRTLWWCPDLAADQIRKGFAHVLSVSANPGDPELLKVQAEAQAARRGMWAHGIPDYVLTSLHSIAEETEDEGAYNRLVSTVDGHSLKWVHDELYPECSTVCDDGAETKARLEAAVKALEADATAGPMTKQGYSKRDLEVLVSDFVRKKDISKKVKKPNHLASFTEVLQKLRDAGQIGREVKLPSCMIYVDFKRRFGGGRAACLK
jgi:endonuclease YncB( thermonuclease family)